MNGLDLFSGIGGMSIGLRDWVRPIAYCEIDPYCQGVLLSRMADESLCNGPIWDDIKTLDGNIFKGAIDIVYGGFPCQDISIAGHGKGLEGERSGLFFEMLRLIKEIQPRFLFIENVPAITSRGGVWICKEIASMGYDCRWCIVSAENIGALHKRKRFFLLAYTNGESSGKTYTFTKPVEIKENTRMGCARQNWANFPQTCWQQSECAVFSLADGLPEELDGARALGNSVVPAQAKEAFKILMGIK